MISRGGTERRHELFHRVEFFACPANAEPEIKNSAGNVSPFEAIEGVIDILSHLNE